MAVSYQHDRQELITGLIEVTYASMTSGTAYSALELPAGAILLDGTYWVTTAFNSGSSDAVVVAFNGLTLLTDSDAQATVRTPFTMPTTSNPEYCFITSPTYITLTWTGAGTAATAGTIFMEARYAVKGRTAFSQG